MRMNVLTSMLEKFHQFELSDDFTGGLVSTRWTAAGDLTAAANVLDPGACLKVTHSTTNNADGLVGSALAPFSLMPNCPIDLVGRMSFGVDAATANESNFFFGLVDSATTLTDFVTDNGAGVNADFEGAGIYKLDSGASGTAAPLRCVTSIGTVQTLTQTNENLAAGTAAGNFITLGVQLSAETPTLLNATFFYDPAGGANLKQLLDVNNRPIKHRFDFSGVAGTNLKVVWYSKQGSTTASAAQLAMVSCAQRRF